MMKTISVVAIWIFASVSLYAQEIKEVNGSYEFEHIFEAPNLSQEDLYNRIKQDYIHNYKEMVQVDKENETIVMGFPTSLGTFMQAEIQESFDFKNEKVRWRIDKIRYKRNITKMSKWRYLDDDPDEKVVKKLEKAIADSLEDIERILARDAPSQNTTNDDNW